MVVAIELARRWTVAAGNTSRLVVGTHLWVGAGALTMIANAVTVGQDQAVTMWYFASVPMIVAYIGSLRAATQWYAITLAAFACVYALPTWSDISQEMVPSSLERLVAQIVSTTGLYLFGMYQRQAAVRQLSIIRRQAEEISEARDAALAASRAKTAFLAGMSHELRTPLHGVTAALDLLRRDAPIGSDDKRRVDIAVAAAAQAHRVVDDILDFTRIEAGAIARDDVDFAISDIATQAADVVRAVAEQKGLDLTTDIDGDVPAVVRGDAGKLRQILVNLLGNAVKFTDVGFVRLAVSWHDSVGAFVVEDSGVGFDPRLTEQMFEKFEQSDTSTTRRYGGTGLGLAISRQLALAMDGTLLIDSTPTVGTRAELTVPLTASDVDVVTITLPPIISLPPKIEPPQFDEGPDGRPLVLVVDDNETNAAVALDILRAIGCRALWMPDGRSALGTVQDEPGITALLLDSHLPGMHGDEVARRTRTIDPSVKIIMLTADVSAENLAGARAAGADWCLGKPTRLGPVREALRHVGVLPELFDLRPIAEARTIALQGRRGDRVRLQHLLSDACEDARAFAESLRRNPDEQATFQRAHRNLVGALVYAAAEARAATWHDSGRSHLLQCLDTALAWEDA